MIGTASAASSLQVTVKNADGATLPSTGGRLDVTLYDSNWNYVANSYVNYYGGESSKYVTFTGLTDGNYIFEVYNTPSVGLRYKEFWGGNSLSVSGSKYFTFYRHTQYSTGATINGQNAYSGAITVTPGTTVPITVIVKNKETGSHYAKVRVIFDRNKATSFDYDATSSAKLISAGGSSTFSFNFQPSLVGTYYFAYVVQGDYGAYVTTDQSNWVNGVTLVTTGSISVSSSPTGATIYLDGVNKGTTPATLTGISPGTHTVKLTKSGYYDYTKTVTVVAGQTTAMSATLYPSTGSISVTSNPTGASIYLDSVYQGTTSKTLSGIAEGTHTIKLTKSGYQDYTTTVTVVAGQTKAVSPTLIPLSSLQVTVYNADGAALPSTGGRIDVTLYDGNRNYITNTYVNYYGGESSKSVTFTNLAAGTYNIDVYNTPSVGLRYKEFWGGNAISVSGTKYFSFYRHSQYATGVSINGQNPSGGPISVGADTNVPITVIVRNKETVAHYAKVRIILDRDKATSFDFDIPSTAKLISAGSTSTFSFNFKTSVGGTYYFAYVVEGDYSGYSPTDQSNWIAGVNVITTGSISVSSSPTGATIYLDGVNKGTTPATLTSISQGTHTVKLTKSGYKDYTTTVTVVAGQTKTVSPTLIPWSSLQVTVKNADGKALPSTGGTLDVTLLDSSRNYLTHQNVVYAGGEASKSVTFTERDAGTYFIDVYNTPSSGLGYREFWGGDTFAVSGTTSFAFERHSQYATGVTINGQNPYAGTVTVTPDTVVPVTVTVRNGETASHFVKVRVILDRDKASPFGTYDFDPTPVEKLISAGQTATFSFDFIPSAGALYYFTYVVEGDYTGYSPTDQSDWIIGALPFTGSIAVSSIPPGASIYLDDEYKGTTPTILTNILQDTYAIRLTKSGYKDYIGTVTVVAGETAIVSETLIPTTGTISVASVPTGADVYLDTVYKGITPMKMAGLLPDDYTVTIAKSGYHEYTETVTLGAGQTITISPTLSEVGTITVKGHIYWTDQDGIPTDARNVKVELLDKDIGFDDSLGTQYTDEFGWYSFTVDNNDGILQGGRDAYIKVYAESPLAYVENNLVPYSWSSDSYEDLQDGSITFIPLEIPASDPHAPVLKLILDAINAEFLWINENIDTPYTAPPQIKVEYPSFSPTGFSPVLVEIDLREGFSRYTVCHEYGHYVMYDIRGNTKIPAGLYPLESHYVGFKSDGGFALNEGWAEFIGCAVDNAPNNVRWNSENIESNQWAEIEDPGLYDGNVTEGCVASVLWDIFDSGNEYYDHIDNQFSKIWKIMTKYNPNDIDQFYDYWELEYGDGEIVDLSEIYWNYWIDKTGKLLVISTPPGADLYIDGMKRGKTGIPIGNIFSGHHIVDVKLDGYITYTGDVDINTNEVTEITVSLLPSTGSVSVTSDPSGASVSLDGVDQGVTPLTISGISEGPHSLTLAKSGYQDYTESVTVVAGQTTSIAVSLTVAGVTPLPGTSNPPRDLDQDGLFEDLNGDGVFSFGDIRMFFENYDVWIPANEPIGCFDYDGNGVIGFGDVRALFLEWGA
ncbi:MAG: hypothetical protein APR53_04245 [Methanoculleus sp. SDB]|nr:MAG: hypothetical protein APR53_04245 [Methanoculleus sp. SDB]